MKSLLSLAAPEIVNMTISVAAIDNKVVTDTPAFLPSYNLSCHYTNNQIL